MKVPKCRFCGERHWGVGHVLSGEAKKSKIVEVISNIPVKPASELKVIKGCTDNSVKAPQRSPYLAEERPKCTDNGNKCTDIRQVGIRELGRNLSAEFQDLPFEVTKGGEVIAVVMSKGGN